MMNEEMRAPKPGIKSLEAIAIEAPPEKKRVRRRNAFARDGASKTRYDLPTRLDTASPVGYRSRLSMTDEEMAQVLPLLSLPRPLDFEEAEDIVERELFEEHSLGILVARQSTNFRGHKVVTLGPETSKRLAKLLAKLEGLEATVLEKSAYTHIVLAKPYRTLFTLLLTFIGHPRRTNILGVLKRAAYKKFIHRDDIPTVGFLKDLHVGILADAMERASVIASKGRRAAQVFMAPFSGRSMQKTNHSVLGELEKLAGLGSKERQLGWRIALVAQVGQLKAEQRMNMPQSLWRKLGANLLAFRSERIQPGVNADKQAPVSYQHRQSMRVPDDLTVQSGRAAYNAFAHWAGCTREEAKNLLLLERVDVLTPNGRERLRDIRRSLDAVSDRVIENIPNWANLMTAGMLKRSAEMGRKAFGLAGQRIYIGGLDAEEVKRAGLGFEHAIRALGAAASRSALYVELMGVMNCPEDCDLLAGICLMAGPINQNDIGKTFYGMDDLLAKAYPEKKPTSLLVWTLKAKTVADPVGNEEQLMNAKRKGKLVDLRPAPHDVIEVGIGGKLVPMRLHQEQHNQERAFADVENFLLSDDGKAIENNRGQPWPEALSRQKLWG